MAKREGRRFSWIGGYTQADSAALTTYHQGLQSQFGFVAVGAPVYRTFTGGAVATALYRQGLVTILIEGAVINIHALLRGVPDTQALQQFTRQTFGLVQLSALEPLHEGVDHIEVYS